MTQRLASVLVAAMAAVILIGNVEARQALTKAATAPAVDKPWPDAAGMAERKREAERRRLFRYEEPVIATLTADFKAVQRDRDPKSTKLFPATISVLAGDGTMATLPLQIRTRGHSRRNAATCTFAPLRLEFDKAVVKGTVFDGHGGLKLGTHCRKGAEDVILREFVLYKMFGLLTPRSFRARTAKMKYVEAGTGKLVAEEPGLFIEDDDDVAKRMEGRIIALDHAVFARLDQETLNRMMLFQYMIGNTDFSIIAQHNVRIVQTQDVKRYTVPYDFDYSGLVDSGYGAVARGLPITDVRDRLYRGPCRTAAEWQPFLDQVRTSKTQILGLLQSVEGLDPPFRRDASKYLGEFFKTIDNPSLVKRELIDPCQKIGM